MMGEPVSRIAVRLPNWLGDTVMAVPALTALRETWPNAEVRATVERLAPGVPVLTAVHEPTECFESSAMRFVPLSALGKAKLLAFAGIGAPDGFSRTLGETAVDVTAFEPFADHHWYTREDLAHLDRRAADTSAEGLITTEKDWVRLRTLPPLRRPVYVLSIRLRLTSGEAAWRAAFERLAPAT